MTWRADFETAVSAALYGVEKGIVMMAAVHPIERTVVDGLQAVFDGEISSLR